MRYAVLGLGLLLLIEVSAAVNPNTTLVSVDLTGTGVGNKESFSPALSADGRYVAFQSSATNLVDVTDNNGSTDVFVRDLRTGKTTLVSVNKSGNAAANRGSSSPSISADGRYVAFDSSATDLVTQPVGFLVSNVYVRDMVLGLTTMVSIDKTGTKNGNNSSGDSAITPDGRFVAFVSGATDLVEKIDTNRTGDVFLRDLQAGVTKLLSTNSTGESAANGTSGVGESAGVAPPVISSDGRFVAFLSIATNLVDIPDTNQRLDLFVRDAKTDTTKLLSLNSNGTGTNGDGVKSFAMSADGRYVAFTLGVANLLPDGHFSDAFVTDLQTNTSVPIITFTVGQLFSGTSSVDISADGRFVAFSTASNNLTQVPDNNNAADVFVRDMVTGNVSLVSVNTEGTSTGNRNSFDQRISGSGRFVVFQSESSDLVPLSEPTPGYTEFHRNVFVRDLKKRQTYLASVSYTGAEYANNRSQPPFLISRNGLATVFWTDASNLVANDTNHTFDVFAFVLPDSLLFDLCLQDDSNRNILRLNSVTGEYEFTNCAGITLNGVGSILKRGGIVTLQDNSANRRILARIDTGVHVATATIQLLSPSGTFSILDRNIENDTCACN